MRRGLVVFGSAGATLLAAAAAAVPSALTRVGRRPGGEMHARAAAEAASARLAQSQRAMTQTLAAAYFRRHKSKAQPAAFVKKQKQLKPAPRTGAPSRRWRR